MQSGILDRIVARKREEIEAARKREELQGVKGLARDYRALAESNRRDRRDFTAALRSESPAIIAEIKKASPSRGVLVENFNPVDLARSYEQGGAAAISVLTDHDFFEGSLADLQAARAACTIPVLRKDFTIAEFHVIEAAAHGADAILLIAAILDVSQLRSFRELAREFGMAALVEAHDAAEVEKSIESGAEIIGINNRDLRTFHVSLETGISLAPMIPSGIIKVAESGIFNASDIRHLMDAGFDAFLVGEHLVKSADPASSLRELAQPLPEPAPQCL